MTVEIIRDDEYGEAGRSFSESGNCLGKEITRCVEERSQYVARIEWGSFDGHMNGVWKGRDSPKFFALARPFFDSVEERRHCEASFAAPRT